MGTIRQGSSLNYNRSLQRLGIDPKKVYLFNVRTIHTKNISKKIEQNDSFYNWLVGFTDGDGCFTIDRLNNGKKWDIVFKISQSKRNAQLIYKIKKELEIGHVTIGEPNDIFTYHIRRRTDFIHTIFPIFDKYPLHTSKYLDYLLIKEAIFILESPKDINLKNLEMERIYKKLLDNSLSIQHSPLINNLNIDW